MEESEMRIACPACGSKQWLSIYVSPMDVAEDKFRCRGCGKEYAQLEIDSGRKTYWVIWTYIANYSEQACPVAAFSPEDAAKVIIDSYGGEEFARKATVYVFDHKPVLVMRKGKKDADAARSQ
jgi:hypothetical protein